MFNFLIFFDWAKWLYYKGLKNAGCTASTTWPDQSFSVWPPWGSDLLLSQLGPGNHGLYLPACGWLLPEWSEPPPHNGPGKLHLLGACLPGAPLDLLQRCPPARLHEP